MRTKKPTRILTPLDFCDYEDLIGDILEELEYVSFEECGSITIIAKYDEAVQVVECLIRNNVKLNAITLLESELYGGYNKEFVITVDIYGVSVEPMWRDAYGNRPAGYLYDESIYCYVFGNCHRQVLDHIDYTVGFEVNIVDCDDCCDCCGECCDDCDEKELDETEIKNLLANLKACNSCNEHCGEKLNIQSRYDDGMCGFTASHSDDNSYKKYAFYSNNIDFVEEMMGMIKKFSL